MKALKGSAQPVHLRICEAFGFTGWCSYIYNANPVLLFLILNTRLFYRNFVMYWKVRKTFRLGKKHELQLVTPHFEGTLRRKLMCTADHFEDEANLGRESSSTISNEPNLRRDFYYTFVIYWKARTTFFSGKEYELELVTPHFEGSLQRASSSTANYFEDELHLRRGGYCCFVLYWKIRKTFFLGKKYEIQLGTPHVKGRLSRDSSSTAGYVESEPSLGRDSSSTITYDPYSRRSSSSTADHFEGLPAGVSICVPTSPFPTRDRVSTFEKLPDKLMLQIAGNLDQISAATLQVVSPRFYNLAFTKPAEFDWCAYFCWICRLQVDRRLSDRVPCIICKQWHKRDAFTGSISKVSQLGKLLDRGKHHEIFCAKYLDLIACYVWWRFQSDKLKVIKRRMCLHCGEVRAECYCTCETCGATNVMVDTFTQHHKKLSMKRVVSYEFKRDGEEELHVVEHIPWYRRSKGMLSSIELYCRHKS